MAYVAKNLIDGESVVYRARLHSLVLLVPIAIDALLTVAGLAMLIAGLSSKPTTTWLWVAGLIFILLGSVVLLSGVVRRSAAELVVTNKRVIFKAGVFRRKTTEMFLQKIESVGVDQNLVGRISNYGTITLRGTGGTTEPFDKVSNPLEFRRQVQQQIGRLLEHAAGAGV